MYDMTKKKKGFTIIELMVSIFVTLIVLGTFFKLYTNFMKSERNTNIRTSVAHIGDQIAENLVAPISLIGLNNNYVDFSAIPSPIFKKTDGGSGPDGVDFQFYSPYGGPISKLEVDAVGTGPACTFDMLGSGSFSSSLNEVQLMSSSGVYVASNLTFPGEDPSQMKASVVKKYKVDGSGAAFVGDCATVFPAGTLVTGKNNEYTISYINSGADTRLRLIKNGTEDLIYFDNDADSEYSVPYFVLQFQREYTTAGGVKRRQWVSEIDGASDPDYIKEIKAIRFGFVMLSMRDRVKKKEAGAGLDTSIDFCPFEGMCYSHSDLNKTAYVFRRLIHIKNFDYLQRNSSISY